MMVLCCMNVFLFPFAEKDYAKRVPVFSPSPSFTGFYLSVSALKPFFKASCGLFRFFCTVHSFIWTLPVMIASIFLSVLQCLLFLSFSAVLATFYTFIQSSDHHCVFQVWFSFLSSFFHYSLCKDPRWLSPSFCTILDFLCMDSRWLSPSFCTFHDFLCMDPCWLSPSFCIFPDFLCMDLCWLSPSFCTFHDFLCMK